MSDNQSNTDDSALLVERVLPDGGFSRTPGGPFKIDCTAWGAIALKACACHMPLRHQALSRLAESQFPDGRVPLLKHFKEDFWPTALSLLAWHPESEFEKNARRAAEFLLATRSVTLPKDPDKNKGHNTELSGWPWVEHTYAWVVPTSLAIIALKVHGWHNHDRVTEGVSLLLDRQLPDGGWNYGDTFVFDTQLLPFPDTTGIALTALSGLCEPALVKNSLRYLRHAIEGIYTPQSLAWALIGLGLWSVRPADYLRRIEQSLRLQARYGIYDTDLLALLMIAGQSRNRLFELLVQQGELNANAWTS